MSQTRIEGDVAVTGTLVAIGGLSVPDGSIDADAIEAAAGIEYTKLEHEHRAAHRQSGTPASATDGIAVIRGATGTLLSVKAGTVVACIGAATITVDVKKNGTTVLSGVITLDSTNTARVAEAGTLSVTTLAAGDLLEVVVVATAGGGTLGTGLFVEVRWAEDAN